MSHPISHPKLVRFICFAAVSTAVVGYFVGLQSPMNPANAYAGNENRKPHTENRKPTPSGVVPATHYTDMHATTRDQAKAWQTSLTSLKKDADLMQQTEINITDQQKTFALQLREQNRAFNGAPPTIPHAIDQMSAASCIACHGNGFKSETLTISKMSHQFLPNCTQCHVERNPTHMAAAEFRESSFVGLPAPTGGARAFAGAPPTIPHSTWMRVDCSSCHGFTGKQGIRSTHPWRTNCTQCHAPSSALDQVELDVVPAFLPPLNLKD